MSSRVMENLPAELSLGLESGDSLDIYLNQSFRLKESITIAFSLTFLDVLNYS